MLHIPHDSFVASRKKLVLHDSRAEARGAAGGLDPVAHQRVFRLAGLLTRSGEPQGATPTAAQAIRFLRRVRASIAPT